jgi:hypothetical protein
MRRFHLLITLLLTVLAQVSLAQEPAVYRPLFDADATLELTIEGPFERLVRERHDKPELDGIVRYTDAAGEEIVLDVGLAPRGNSRLDICSFPPIWLNFKRGQLPGTVFAGQNRIKLVTLCRESDSYRDYLAQEYQLYRAYNALTEHSFRVRWLTVEYVETEGRRPSSTTESAFLIEEDWEVAERAGMEAVKVDSLRFAQLDSAGAALIYLFQYMIGGTDWSPIAGPPGETCCHNTKLIGPANSDAGRLSLPYDFDQVGLVNANYARPAASVPIRSVTQRYYRGYCVLNDDLEATIELMNERRSDVEAAFASLEVKDRARKRALSFLEESYERINDPRRIEREILNRCRG